MGTMTTPMRIFAWFSYSHWGMVRLPILTAPDWYAFAVERDDDLLEYDDRHPDQ